MSNPRPAQYLASLLLPLLLGACAGGAPPAPDDHYYRLLPSQPPARAATPPIAGTLKVEPVKAYGIYRERALLYARQTHPEGLQQHRYHYWIDTPTRLIRDQLVDYLRASGVAHRVAGAQIAQHGDVRLKLTLKQFERVIGADRGTSVRVALDAVITDSRGHPLKITGYARELAAADASIPASVNALNLALRQIYGELLGDLRGLGDGPRTDIDLSQ
jgi:ABC-type uncharacterized transport system auxiliary subunit